MVILLASVIWPSSMLTRCATGSDWLSHGQDADGLAAGRGAVTRRAAVRVAPAAPDDVVAPALATGTASTAAIATGRSKAAFPVQRLDDLDHVIVSCLHLSQQRDGRQGRQNERRPACRWCAPQGSRLETVSLIREEGQQPGR
jgi:hypothetical protein